MEARGRPVTINYDSHLPAETVTLGVLAPPDCDDTGLASAYT